MRADPLPALRVLRALELFGPQARPYNFDDMFDCWGLLRRVFDWLDDGAELNDELGGDDRSRTVANWAPIEDRGALLPGDVLTTHPHASPEFHVVMYGGRAGDVDLVYDSSPRGDVPLFDRAGRLRGSRPILTRYMRAPETTDRLRNDGGAWLRLYDGRVRFFHRGLHARLLAADPSIERDLVRLRRAAGLSELPSYCTAPLETDGRGREVYDNRATRHLDYYVPDGVARPAAQGAPRPVPPSVVGPPHRVLGDADWSVAWRPGDDTPVRGWRVEVWEETADLWKHRLLRRDLGASRRRFVVPRELLRDDARFAVVLWAHGEGGHSGNALATALVRPDPGNPLVAYNPVRPTGLRPDGLAAVAASGPGRESRPGVELTWCVPRSALTQTAARVRVLEDASLADAVAPVFEATLEGPAAAECRCRPPATVFRAGHTYAWYVETRDAAGRWCYAPSEGLFTVAGDA